MTVKSNFEITLVCIATACDWLRNLSPLNFRPIRSKTNRDFSHAFSRAWRRLHVFTLSSDWFIGLSPSVVIGQSNYFGLDVIRTHSEPALERSINQSINKLYLPSNLQCSTQVLISSSQLRANIFALERCPLYTQLLGTSFTGK